MSELTRFEKTRLVSARALQLSMGAPPLVKAISGITSFELAKAELLKKVLPLTVLRRFPGKKKLVEVIEIE